MGGLKVHFSLYKKLSNFDNLWKIWKGFNAIISKLVINEFSTLSIWIFEDYFLVSWLIKSSKYKSLGSFSLSK